MFAPLILTALLTGGSAAPTFATGSHVLLTGTVITQAGANQGTGNAKPVYLTQPALTDIRGQPVAAQPWLNTPLTVKSQTAAAYILSGGQTVLLLPKRNLATRAVFALVKDKETQALAGEFVSRMVWPNGRLHGPCEIAAGYHADAEARRARVVGVWRVQALGFAAGSGLSLSPQGGLVQGDMVHNERVSASSLFVQFSGLEEIKALSAVLDSSLQDQSAKLMALAPQRCTHLGVQCASADDLRRSLSLSAPPAHPPREGDPDKAEKALLGQTRQQVLALYGSPNELGTLEQILKLPRWNYGAGGYDNMQIDFGMDRRVIRAAITRIP
ncbi:hypothetical protein FNU79_01190 [Deinococcus detaillensis]|uniref:Uncharacterized protein n=1 Tax=Deinococcus detaillensis TaxID=2592048 RepID=A0A553V600_9DEIO|nr:hypothetical protein [Deinococcus detaillensis]TSA87892.1 hypothetical protein FNU79_01190 [Deinococcus detaillensis]